jgi:transcriptional regulator of heat shock response
MTEGLSARQIQILKSLIDEYIETAEPVGSETLDKKYNLGISSATIRNEMVALTSSGHLKQPHTSAGRIPTPKAMKFYINQLMEERQMSLTDEVKAKEEVWDVRKNMENLMCEITGSLARATNSLAIAVLDDHNRIWHSGYANVFLNPEFANIEATANLFSVLEEVDRIHEMFFKMITGTSPVEVLFGEELGWPEMEPTGIVATRFKIKDSEGVLGVIGPVRLSYSTIIPVIRYYKNLIEEVAQ